MTSSNHRFSVTDLDIEIDSDNRWIRLDIKSNVRVTVAQDDVDKVAVTNVSVLFDLAFYSNPRVLGVELAWEY